MLELMVAHDEGVDDWELDTEGMPPDADGGASLAYGAFLDSLVELVDLQTSSLRPAERVGFVRELSKAVVITAGGAEAAGEEPPRPRWRYTWPEAEPPEELRALLAEHLRCLMADAASLLPPKQQAKAPPSMCAAALLRRWCTACGQGGGGGSNAWREVSLGASQLAGLLGTKDEKLPSVPAPPPWRKGAPEQGVESVCGDLSFLRMLDRDGDGRVGLPDLQESFERGPERIWEAESEADAAARRRRRRKKKPAK